ncbi:molybdopterin-dependent oxidoreductase [Paucibacter sp. JuS9]|uniref:nitrate reductase n=1 Tax=Paucibacter sp. JuS9 TaxID=3228748 RepID=UPI003757FA79
MTDTRSTCPYCGVGCGVIIESDAGQITGVRGDPDHPANFGRLCSKGSTLHLTATPIVLQTKRLHHPQHRAARGDELQALSWDEANQRIADKLLSLRADHGPDAIGFYISGQLLTEDYHAFNKLARGLVGTNNIDSNSRLCMSSAVVGYKQSLGSDAPPACYEDLDRADCLFITGSNMAWAHPILFRRIEAARAARPEMKIIVVDPRRTETAEFADLHLQIQPGTDVALCLGMLHAMVWEGWIDANFIAEHTEGFDALKALARDMPPAKAARQCGISEADLLQAARWFATSESTLSLYCMGLNQSTSGTAKNTALINLHLASGQIGRPGAGPFSLTGQPNAMGGRETGGMATLLPGHRDPTDADHRAEIARLWGVDALPATAGKTAVELFEAAARGEVKALWIACTNPAQSLPNQALVRAALERCELVILQEAFTGTATAAYADFVLPAATWGEKEGTVTNSERRISRVRAAILPPGEARPDWQIARDIAQRLEVQLRPGLPSLFGVEGPEALWLEHREATRGRDLDITGLTYAMLERSPQQWPCPEAESQGRARLYQDSRFATANGRARFVSRPFAAAADKIDASFALALTTGRMRDQWHGMSRSGAVPRLMAFDARPAVRLNPQDLARRGLKDGGLGKLTTRRGSLVLPMQADETVACGQAYVPMHWGAEFIGGDGINALTQDAFCPDARQPELKFSAMNVQSAELPWRISAAAWVPAAESAALREQLRALMPEFGYVQCLPAPPRDEAFGGSEGWCLDAALAQAPHPALLQRLAAILKLEGTGVLRYADTRRGRHRALRLSGEGDQARLQALLRVGEGEEGAWLTELWREAQAAAPHGRWLLAPEAQAPQGMQQSSPQVCNCFNVREDSIRACLGGVSGSPNERLAQLQGQLKCGTQCGSCLPSLRRLVSEVREEVIT